MTSILRWIKNNKLTILLLLIIFYLVLKNRPSPLFYSYNSRNLDYDSLRRGEERTFEAIPAPHEALPTTGGGDRLVIRESSLSLLVDNVVKVQKLIIKKAQDLGGYMVDSYLDNPQETATATVIIRVPKEKLEQALTYFRGLSIKVIVEKLQGQDVTDQYIDIEARLKTLYKTKARFEKIMEKATQVQDILTVQREIINLQSQIDSLKGQQQYYEKNAEMAKLTIYLSTDELALPYTPSELWRPKVIFKQAVRSLISSLRKIVTLLIWLVVYSVIWLPVMLLVFFFYYKRQKNPSLKAPSL
mgnify:CR=1 FL=1